MWSRLSLAMRGLMLVDRRRAELVEVAFAGCPHTLKTAFLGADSRSNRHARMGCWMEGDETIQMMCAKARMLVLVIWSLYSDYRERMEVHWSVAVECLGLYRGLKVRVAQRTATKPMGNMMAAEILA